MEKYLILLKKLRKLLKNYNYKIHKRKIKCKCRYGLIYNNNSISYIVLYYNFNEMFLIEDENIVRDVNVFSMVHFVTTNNELRKLMENIYSRSIEEIILKLQLLGY